MTMTPDTQIGPYEITRDTKLALLAAWGDPVTYR